jgi:hypothetical protein
VLNLLRNKLSASNCLPSLRQVMQCHGRWLGNKKYGRCDVVRVMLWRTLFVLEYFNLKKLSVFLCCVRWTDVPRMVLLLLQSWSKYGGRKLLLRAIQHASSVLGQVIVRHIDQKHRWGLFLAYKHKCTMRSLVTIAVPYYRVWYLLCNTPYVSFAPTPNLWVQKGQVKYFHDIRVPERDTTVQATVLYTRTDV